MPNEILQHDDEANELARVAPSVPLSATGTTAKIANGLSQHTPGPWRVAVIAGFYEGKPTASVWVEAGDYYSLASLMPVAEVQANANLMAAAPDLLAALKHIAHNRAVADHEESVILGEPCRRCGERFGVVPGTQPDLCEDCFIAAAIAKAEGRS